MSPMFKSPLAALALIMLVAGCVNVAGPSAEPSITPAPATPSPSTAPTATATAIPTATVAPTPTSAPTATAAPTPAPTEGPGFDRRDVDFIDDLGDPSGHCTSGPAQDPPEFWFDCFGVGSTVSGEVAYDEGALRFDMSVPGAWLYSRRLARSTSATMRVIGDFHPTKDGYFGPACASEDDKLFAGVVGTDGSWAFVKIGNDGPEPLFFDSSAGLDVVAGESNLVALECAGTATGSLRLTLWFGTSGPVATWTQPNGPENFDRAGAYVNAWTEGFSVAMDNVVTFGSGRADGSFGRDGEELLAHVPQDWQSSCYQGLRPPYLADTAEAVVTCFLASSNTEGAEIAEYASFASAADMEAAYQGRIAAFGAGDVAFPLHGASSCRDASGEGPYTIDDIESGRLLCVDQFAGMRLDWTDTRLNVLGTLIDFDGDYSAAIDDWLIAGPDL
jgi:hypothetical protein